MNLGRTYEEYRANVEALRFQGYWVTEFSKDEWLRARGKPTYLPKLPPKDWTPYDNKDLNPFLLVLLIAGLSLIAGLFGCLIAEYCS